MNQDNTITSLTAPHDRAGMNKQTNPQSVVLTEDEVQAALETNIDNQLIHKFRKVDKFYADPIYNNQVYALHSFVPSKNAQPDEHGVFGFMKCRGTFQTEQEANERAEYLIRNLDSYHNIQTTFCGRPFPVCADTKRWVAETTEIDIRKKAVETISEDIKQKRLEEKQTMEDIKEREKKLFEESKAAQDDVYEEDPIDKYTTIHVKKANLVFTYIKTQEKIQEMKKAIRTAYKEIREMDEQDDTLQHAYYEKYMNARRESGIPDEVSEDNWMKYLVEDVELDFDVYGDEI